MITDYGYPFIEIRKKEIFFKNGRFCNLPKDYLKPTNKEKLRKFYKEILSKSSSKEISFGIDPLGFTYLNLDFICYVGLITDTSLRSKYNSLRKKYPLNKFDIEYLKKQILFEYDLSNFKEFIPIQIVTQNLHELRGLNSQIAGNIDTIMDINSEDEWDNKFDNQDETVKKIYVGSRLIKFILDNIKFYQPNFFKNLEMKYDKTFIAHRSVSKIVKIYRNDFKKGLADIEFKGSCSTRVRGDKNYFEILIKILVENAQKYSEFPKRIGPKVNISNKGNYLIISIHSYGRAIPETERPYLFSKGFRSTVNKRSKEGSGMGLYNAAQIAKHFFAEIDFTFKDASKEENIDLAWNIFTLKIKKK